ncbi:hypothetical protein [Amycolatopsis pittospori]|uniref:hypothetical protein n=1 Tax=Amycolatopsis pittospori TaxID=2749434 RepID=UPI0015F002CF|nr:hypothetical protein [Amycolatopsis pittospori]
MPRIRTIKPSFFRSEDVAALPLRARLTWIGLWTHCDDQGRTKDNARLIKGDIWPLDDVSLADIEEDLETLAAHERIVRYTVGGRRYLAIVNWHDHQSIQKPTPSKLPPVEEGTPLPVRSSAMRATGDLPEETAGYPQTAGTEPPPPLQEDSGSPTTGKGKEGKGKEGRARGREAGGDVPPSRCSAHRLDENPPPCRACAEAREARKRWDTATAARIAARRTDDQRARAADRARAIAACGMCDDNGYVETVLCNHDPGARERAARGMDLVRAAMKSRTDTTTAKGDHL